jgi:hypothetical protein
MQVIQVIQVIQVCFKMKKLILVGILIGILAVFVVVRLSNFSKEIGQEEKVEAPPDYSTEDRLLLALASKDVSYCDVDYHRSDGKGVCDGSYYAWIALKEKDEKKCSLILIDSMLKQCVAIIKDDAEMCDDIVDDESRRKNCKYFIKNDVLGSVEENNKEFCVKMAQDINGFPVEHCKEILEAVS